MEKIGSLGQALAEAAGQWTWNEAHGWQGGPTDDMQTHGVRFTSLSLWESRPLRAGEGLRDGLFVLDKRSESEIASQE
jgi:hypothetical protein